jgi:hypothetical protein
MGSRRSSRRRKRREKKEKEQAAAAPPAKRLKPAPGSPPADDTAGAPQAPQAQQLAAGAETQRQRYCAFCPKNGRSNPGMRFRCCEVTQHSSKVYWRFSNGIFLTRKAFPKTPHWSCDACSFRNESAEKAHKAGVAPMALEPRAEPRAEPMSQLELVEHNVTLYTYVGGEVRTAFLKRSPMPKYVEWLAAFSAPLRRAKDAPAAAPGSAATIWQLICRHLGPDFLDPRGGLRKTKAAEPAAEWVERVERRFVLAVRQLGRGLRDMVAGQLDSYLTIKYLMKVAGELLTKATATPAAHEALLENHRKMASRTTKRVAVTRRQKSELEKMAVAVEKVTSQYVDSQTRNRYIARQLALMERRLGYRPGEAVEAATQTEFDILTGRGLVERLRDLIGLPLPLTAPA